MIMNTATVTIQQYNSNRLSEEHQKNIQSIERIKLNIGQEIDNIGNAVPLFEQLETGG